jgi:hypothetical protein
MENIISAHIGKPDGDGIHCFVEGITLSILMERGGSCGVDVLVC